MDMKLGLKPGYLAGLVSLLLFAADFSWDRGEVV